jgi:hypothetical protein
MGDIRCTRSVIEVSSFLRSPFQLEISQHARPVTKMKINKPGELWPRMLKASIPAYIFPWLCSYGTGLMIGDRGLQAASWSIIAIPSAAAAALVTIILGAPRLASLRKKVQNLTLVVLVCGAICAAVSGVAAAIWYEIFGGPIQFVPILASSAVGGAITAATWAWPRRVINLS